MKLSQFHTFLESMTNTHLNLVTSRAASAIYIALKSFAKSGHIIIPSTICLSPIVVANLANFQVSFAGIKGFNMNLEEVVEYLELHKEINAILLPELYGYSVPKLELFWECIKHRDILVIEDLAQSLGASRFANLQGKPTVVTIYSFGPNKVLNRIQAGALSTKDDSFFSEVNAVYSLMDHSDPIAHNKALKHYGLLYANLLAKNETDRDWQSFYRTAAKLNPVLYIPKVVWPNDHINVDLNITQEIDIRNERHFELVNFLDSFEGILLPDNLNTSHPVWRTTIRVPRNLRDSFVSDIRRKGMPVSTWYKAMHTIFENYETSSSKSIDDASAFEDEVLNFFLDLPQFHEYLGIIKQSIKERIR